MKQDRFKSKVLWLAILAQVLTILLLTGTITVAESELINNIFSSVLQILVLFGVINSPDNKDKL
jgi:uncharacterized membrane protein